MPSLAATAARLSHISAQRQANPHARFGWPARADRDRPAMSESLLSLAGHPILAAISDEQRWRLALQEAVHFFSLNIAGERELLAGLAERLRHPAGQLAMATEYLVHFLQEEGAHTVVFSKFCIQYGGEIYPDRQVRLPRRYLPGEEEFLFFAKVLVFEEIANYFNIHMAHDQDIWPLAREINEYHAIDEGRHITFGRKVVAALWEESSAAWGAEGRAQVSAYLQRYIVSTLRQYVSPFVYRDLALSDDPMALRQEVFALPARAELERAATWRIIRFLNSLEGVSIA